MKNISKIISFTSLALACISIFGCKSSLTQQKAADSFLPMQIGNYWKMSATSYTSIQDTVKIDGKIYYKFYSLIGGDATSTVYLRIDERNRLVESYPDQPKNTYIRADFNAKVGDTFFTLNDKTENDYQVKVLSKTDTTMVFEFDMVYHPNLKGSTHLEKYIKGKGWADQWKEIKIDGVVYKN